MTPRLAGEPIRLALLVRRLDLGGAERQLVELAKRLPAERFATTILTFYPGGYPGGGLVEEVRRAGIEVLCLDKSGRWDLAFFQMRLVAALRRLRIDLLHAFEAPPGLLALTARPFVSDLRVVWGIRAAHMELGHFDYSRRVVFAIAKRLAGRADLVVANSRSGAAYVQAHGFPGHNLEVVANGIDVERFAPDEVARHSLRAGWGVADDETLIGIVARLDPMKDHETFFRAVADLAAADSKARFVCVGDGPERQRLQASAQSLGLGGRLIWAGVRHDMPQVYSALDVNTLTSTGEGFPNTLGEAMACGTPCVATDVGDTADIVGDLGHLAKVGDATSVATGWRGFVGLDPGQRADLKERCRERICQRFSTQVMVQRYAAHYQTLLARCAASQG